MLPFRLLTLLLHCSRVDAAPAQGVAAAAFGYTSLLLFPALCACVFVLCYCVGAAA